MSAAYSLLDRTLHRIAFARPGLQRRLALVEDDLFVKAPLAALDRPVFVTGLARAGTTLTLSLLHGGDAFASFTYRHMPFVMAPLLWARLTAAHQRTGAARERAHGDGMTVEYDSPEAFDEAIWLNLLGDRIVADDHLRPLGADAVTPDVRGVFRSSVQKLLQLEGRGRYLSKNNALMSRLPALRTVFPEAVVLVVIRDPAAHVASLMAQHERFLAVHAEDRFAADYMRWLGHYEFGEAFRPLGLGGVRRPAGVPDPAFWLDYWTKAYEAAAADPAVRLIDYDALRAGGAGGLARLAAAAGLTPDPAFLAQADGLRAPTSTPSEATLPPAELRRARDLHADLAGRAARD